MSSEVTRRSDREEAHVDVAMSMQNEVSWKKGGGGDREKMLLRIRDEIEGREFLNYGEL